MMGLWWILLIILAIAIGSYFVRQQSGPAQSPAQSSRRDTPQEALERRYAEGDISTEEYEERKRKLTGDM
jgi:putative membrane protein